MLERHHENPHPGADMSFPTEPSLDARPRGRREGPLFLVGFLSVLLATGLVYDQVKLHAQAKTLGDATSFYARGAIQDWVPSTPDWMVHPGRVALVYFVVLLLLVGAGYALLQRQDRDREGEAGDYQGLGVRNRVFLVLGVVLLTTLTGWVKDRFKVPGNLILVIEASAFLPFLPLLILELQRGRAYAWAQRDLALQARLAPHMLFNVLSRLKGQIREDPGEAQVTVDRLAELHRELMDHVATPRVPLSQELRLVEACLGLERARLGARLQVELDVPEYLEEVPVPPLCLQVLVENALKHGVDPRPQGGRILIRAWKEASGLRLLVEDPGDGLGTSGGTGRALALLRRRLRHPEDLQLGALPEGGHRALLRVRPA